MNSRESVTAARSPVELEKTIWDAIVVGSGMGGATVGYQLARAGRSVLFLEKGASFLETPADAIVGLTPEETCDLASLDEGQRGEILARAGRSSDLVTDASSDPPKRFVPEIGSGTGGSTALFGMVLERMFPCDFTPRQNHPDAADASLPESWPIAYEDLLPYYEAVERLFRVRGTADPLRRDEPCDSLIAPPPLTKANADLFEYMRQRGLHPYQLHLACEHLDGCQTCQGFLCGRACKNDAGRVCLEPAVRQHGAIVLSRCTVTRLEATRTAVERVVCRWRGQTLALRGKFVVLAAGGLATPVLLLNSKSELWPTGLANDNDLVGRNLMRHCIDMTVLRPRKLAEPITGQTKELSFNDFYLREGRKYGSVQSIGGLPPFLHYLGKLSPRWRFLRYLRPILGPSWDWARRRVIVLASILEDPPYADNRVVPGDRPITDGSQSITLYYRLRERERNRAREYARELRELFEPYRPFTLSVSQDNKVIAHVCGTCRFGDDPKTSVLDRNCRAHGLENLYVADASFFPSSGGINPSLTIAAGALRLGEHLHSRL
jgi:choline dehydrogenase-like flavoprotein